MIKVVSRPFLGKEKYKDFRLCYIDSISETVYDLTPESKVWKRSAEYKAIKKRLEEEVKQGFRDSIYSMHSPLIYRLQGQDYPNPKYQKGKAELYAYFTEVPLSEQWGDDWDDAPYRIFMGQRTNILLQIEGHSGARLNRVYHLQWGYRKYLPMAFLQLLSKRYFKPVKKDIFQFCTEAFELDGLTSIDKDWIEFNFNKLKYCQKALSHCDNNNGAMVVVVIENESVCIYPTYKVGFLLGSEGLEGEESFCRWVSTVEFMKHQPRYDELYDNVFARAFDALTIASGTEHLVTTVIG